MATDSAVMDRRVTALEQYIDKNDPLVSRFYVLEQKTYNVEDDITEIKERLARMETKLDNLANRQASAKSSQPLAQAKPTPAPQTVSYSYTSYNDTPTADQSAQTKQGEKKDKDSEEAPTPPTVLGTLKKIVGL